MRNELKSKRIQLMISNREAQAIEDYRWRNRIQSQAEAIRQLITCGLKAEIVKEAKSA